MTDKIFSMRTKLVASALGGAVVLLVAGAGQVLAQDDELADQPGKATVAEVCTQCHSAGLITARNRPPEEWNDLVGRMIGMGASATDEQQKAILAYLTANYSPKPAKAG